MRKFSGAAAIAVAVLLTLPIVVPVGPADAGTMVAQASVNVTGHVTGSGTAGGLSGATVSLDGPTRASATTDASGNYSLSVPPGVYTVTVNKGGYQTGSTEVVVSSTGGSTVDVELTESSLNNLQVIGRTTGTVSGNGAKFNISSSASSALSQALIQERTVPDLPKVMNSLPGLVVSTNSSTNNSFPRFHGFGNETLVTIDGHPISSGVSGTFLGQFSDTGLLGGVDIYEGAGLNGPTAGESAIGTLNIRTPDFTATNKGFLQAGVDNFGGSFWTGLASGSVGKFSFVLGKSFSGYYGTSFNQNVYGITGTRPNPNGTYTAPYLTNNVVGYSADFSSPQELNAQLAKVRYRLSSATSIGFEFFGLQAQYNPEGAAFGQFVGFATIPQCVAGGVAASGANCKPNSSYNSPFLPTITGAVNVPLYQMFPNTMVSNNNPNFSLDFKTTIGNDTLLFRPYTTSITRVSNGYDATGIYGNGSTAQASFQVLTNANCQVQFVAATAAGGAKGPCYQVGALPGTPGYVTALPAGTSTVFPVTTAANGINCTAAAPCYTTTTNQNNTGAWGFSTPAFQLENDKLGGYTFSYIHPVGNNTYNLSLDHYYNDTTSFSGDMTPLTAGCAFTQGGATAGAVAALKPGDPGLQPTCPLAGATGYKATPLAIPETFNSVTSIALTAQFQLTPKLELDLGNYFTHYAIYGQQENPAFLTAFGAAQVAAGDPVNLSLAPIVLSGFVNSSSHYDPHIGLVFRPTRDITVRATAGTSISVPYASLSSGLISYAPVTSGFAFTVPAPNILPEEIVAYDLGGDVRFKNGTVVSVDIFNDFVHNTWLQTQIPIPAPAGFATNVSYFNQINLNGSGRESYGVEGTIADLPRVGVGYSLSGTFNRLFYVNLPPSFVMLGTYTANFEQDYGYPYVKGYANLQYAFKGGSMVRFGADYEGTNNSFNAPAYVLLDAGGKVALHNGYAFQVGIENLNNINFGALLAHAVFNQGQIPVLQTLNPNGTTTFGNGPSRGLSAPFARTARFSLIKNF